MVVEDKGADQYVQGTLALAYTLGTRSAHLYELRKEFSAYFARPAARHHTATSPRTSTLADTSRKNSSRSSA